MDNPGFGEAKEHVSRLASVSMKISSAYIYLLETGSVGGEEAAKFFKKLMKRESLSCNYDHNMIIWPKILECNMFIYFMNKNTSTSFSSPAKVHNHN